MISILVPVYGVAQYIERCARSIFGQTYADLEIIFVDDATTDESIDVVRRVLSDYPQRQTQTRILRHDHNRGLAAARNTAMDTATGEFVFIVDGDDYLEPDAISLLVAEQQHTGADIVTGYAYVNDADRDQRFQEPEYASPREMLKNILTQNRHHEIWNRLIRRSLLTAHGLRWIAGANHSEDHRMMAMLAFYARRTAVVKQFTYHYVENHSSLTFVMEHREDQTQGMTQDYTNLSAMAAFFHDKDASLYQKALLPVVRVTYDLMWQYLLLHKRHEYYLWRVRLFEHRALLSQAIDGLAHSRILLLLSLPCSYALLQGYVLLSKLTHASHR